MIETPLDLLYLVLALAVFIIAIVIAVLGFQVSHILRDLEKILDRTDRVTEHVEGLVMMPMRFLDGLVSRFDARK